MEDYAAYLTTLSHLSQTLEELSELARKKLAAVRQDDLDALNKVLNREQALALSVRSLEQKMRTQLEQLGMADTSLRDLPARFPDGMRAQAKATTEQLTQQYQVYKGVADAARAALECGLHEIEKVLGSAGAELESPELPSQLRTDIHA
jgi:hypothetical protein